MKHKHIFLNVYYFFRNANHCLEINNCIRYPSHIIVIIDTLINSIHYDHDDHRNYSSIWLVEKNFEKFR